MCVLALLLEIAESDPFCQRDHAEGTADAGMALEAVTEFAQVIDTLARRVEAAITPSDDVETAPKTFEQPLQGAWI